jgi:hypothetical protein
MNGRPKKPLDPRAVVDGAARAMREPETLLADAAKKARETLVDPPENDLAQTVLTARRLLGRELREEDIGKSLHGPDELVRFPRYLIDFFAAVGTDEAATLLVLSSLNDDELAAILKVARREADRTVFHRVWSATWKAGLAIAIPVYGFAKWGYEQVPFLKELFGYLKGHSG